MEPIAGLVAASGVALAGWFAAAGTLAWQVRPSRPLRGRETTDLGPEPPAVVNLLTQDFRVTTEAVPATLLDLAARGILDVDLVGGGRHAVRPRPSAPALGLAPYEAQVLAHVERLAVGGVVPAEALTTGPKDVSRRWWHRFREAVIDDAQRRRLCRNRWTGGIVGGLWAGAFVPGLLFAVAVRFDLDNALESGGSALAMLGTFAMLGLLVALTASRAQRDLPAGLAAASRWLGVREGLARNERLRDAPPSSVAVWERHLAHAVAMGLAPAAAEGLPLGAEDDRSAWSTEGGRWRRVRVSYPRLRPGWGLDPHVAIALGALALAPAALILFALAPFAYPEPTSIVSEGFALLLGRLQTGFVTVVAAAAAGAIATIGQAAADLGGAREVTGTVLRLRTRKVAHLNPWRHTPKTRFYVALDDGRHDRVAAWSVSPAIYERLSQGERVTLRVTPLLRHVSVAAPQPHPQPDSVEALPRLLD